MIYFCRAEIKRHFILHVFRVLLFQTSLHRLFHTSQDDTLACRSLQQSTESKGVADCRKGPRCAAIGNDKGCTVLRFLVVVTRSTCSSFFTCLMLQHYWLAGIKGILFATIGFRCMLWLNMCNCASQSCIFASSVKNNFCAVTIERESGLFEISAGAIHKSSSLGTKTNLH